MLSTIDPLMVIVMRTMSIHQGLNRGRTGGGKCLPLLWQVMETSDPQLLTTINKLVLIEMRQHFLHGYCHSWNIHCHSIVLVRIKSKDWSWYDDHSHNGGDGFRLCVSLKGVPLLQGAIHTVGGRGSFIEVWALNASYNINTSHTSYLSFFVHHRLC